MANLGDLARELGFDEELMCDLETYTVYADGVIIRWSD